MRRFAWLFLLAGCLSPTEQESPHVEALVSRDEIRVYRAVIESWSDSLLILPVTDADASEVSVIREFGSPFAPADSGAWEALGERAAETATIPSDSKTVTGLRVVPPSQVEQVQRSAPGTVEYIQFSRVGFAPSGNTAVVLVRSMCGFNCGGASYLLLRLENGRWKVDIEEPAWVI